jgi:hypothetical protein
VDRSGDQLLSITRFSHNQYTGIGRRHYREISEHTCRAALRPDDALEKLLSAILVFPMHD